MRESPDHHSSSKRPKHNIQFKIGLLILTLIGILILSDWLLSGWLSPWIRYALAATLAVNVIAAIQLWQDKRKAIQNQFRIPETRLLIYDLLGGWPAGLMTKQIIRHKTEKRSYRIKSGIAILMHLSCVTLLVLWRMKFI